LGVTSQQGHYLQAPGAELAKLNQRECGGGKIFVLTLQRGCKSEVKKILKRGRGPLSYVNSPQLEFGL